ncbi:MAG: DUF2721 domain-containing protein [Bacteroidetes bacterium]|nr:MAG: DUF2721 domain-containing protein [Bacteroidota bacterium]
MDISINTPALLFPAISLVMLAYTNRFLAISSVARSLHDKYVDHQASPILKDQIRNLRHRLRLVRQMQLFGVLSFLLALLSMYFIYQGNMSEAHFSFATSVVLFALSLILSLVEIWKSTRSVELHLSDIEDAEPQSMVDVIKSKIGK